MVHPLPPHPRSNLQGTFSGTLLRNGQPDKVVTDGGFNCNIFSF